MSEEVEPVSTITVPKNTKGDVIQVKLTDDEKNIIKSFTKSNFFDSLFVIFNQIVNEGTVFEKDVNRIDDFIIDWQVEHPDEALPRPLQFIQAVLLPKLNNLYTEPISPQPPITTQPQQNRVVAEEPEIVFNGENLPSYIGKINDLIEKEVRRRVRIEMKDYTELKNDYANLQKKMAEIQKLFGPRS